MEVLQFELAQPRQAPRTMRLRASLEWMSTRLVDSTSHCSRVTHVGSASSSARISAALVAPDGPSSAASSSASSPAV